MKTNSRTFKRAAFATAVALLTVTVITATASAAKLKSNGSRPPAQTQTPKTPATLSGTKNIPGDYPTLAAAITDLNAQGVGAGGVTLNLLAGNPETAPAGGYVIGGTGSLVLTTSSAANPIIIQGNANTITASAALTVGALNDAIFKLIGADWVTITGFAMQENAANTVTTLASNNMTEWGVAVLYVTTTDGAQNNTISNNTITLNRTYANTFGLYSNSTHSATSISTSATATGAAGGNHSLKIYGNNISNVNNGIVVVGPTAAADANTGIDIGGAGGAQANSITNFGTTGTFSGYANVSGTVNGILVRNSTGFNVSFNTVTSSVGGTTAGTLNGIQIPAASNAPTGAFTNAVNSNIISLQSAVTAGAINGINYPSGSASTTSTANINGNNFNTFGHTVAASGAITFITVASTNQITTINSNTFTNMSVNTTGSVTFISNSMTAPAGGTKTVNNNSIVTGFTKTGAGGQVTGFTDGSLDVNGVVHNNNNNNFSNITVTGATSILGWSNANGTSTVSGPTKTITGNTFSNWTGGTSSITALSSNFGGDGTNVSNNTISNITYAPIATGTALTGISIGASNGGATQTCSNNTISGLSTTGTGAQTIGILGGSTAITTFNINNNTVNGISSTSAAGPVVAGIFNQNTGATVNIFKNKVYDVTCSPGAVIGINSTAAAATNTINVSNNYVGRLYATTSGFFQAARGLLLQSTVAATFNAYFNTVYLDGTTPTQTYCVYIGGATASVPNVNARNNIFANNVTSSNGAALPQTVYFRVGTTNSTNLASTTNNNLLYARTPAVDHLIYVDGAVNALTNPMQTLAAYKAFVGPRESASFTELPPFLNTTTGSLANYLHIDSTIATHLESGAVNIAGITDDYDNDIRQGNPGYSGSGTAPDVGADEFGGTALAYNADLSNLVLSAGAIAPPFDPNTTSYTLSVSNATTSTTVTPTAADSTSTITVNGVPVASGTPSGSIPLAVGLNTITTIVTAQDGTTMKTYTVTVTRAASSNADLSNLTLSDGTLNPAFDPATTSYTAGVPNATSSITVTPTAADAANATIQVRVNGGSYSTVPSGTASGPLALNVGSNPVDVKVTAQDATMKIYTVTVTRAPSSNANLSNLTLSSGVLDPAFDPNTISYTASVGHKITSITVTPTVQDPTATVMVNGTPVTSGTPSDPIALNVGDNTITILVSAQDEMRPNAPLTTKTYTVVVNRAAVPVVSNTSDSGPGSLRFALANVLDGETINFTISAQAPKGANTPTVSIITLTSGELVVDTNVTINGPGANIVTVMRDGAAPAFRIFHIMPGHTVMIGGLTINNGLAQGSFPANAGGGILTEFSTLTVNNCVISGNAAGFGGGIFSDGNTGLATLNVDNSTLSGNSATNSGGAIYSYGESPSSAVTTVSGSTLSGNLASFGGGIFNDGTAGSAMLTVTNCTLSANSTSANSGSGGGIYNFGEESGAATVTVLSSTLDGNSAASGGAIYNDGESDGTATVNLSNSTLSANSADDQAGGIFNDGFSGIAALNVSNSTLSGNSAAADQAGGIYNNGGAGKATLDIGNTILNIGAASGANIVNNEGTIVSHGYNLASDVGVTNVFGSVGALNATGDQVNTDPMLGPLKNNGGPTKTHAPLIDSPAIDQGKRDTIPALTSNFDQRGFTRPVDDSAVPNAVGGDASDIGAVELAEFVHPTDAASRKTHGGAGDFDVVLPLTGAVGIECRGTGAATNAYKLIVNFAAPITLSNVIITSGTGTVDSFMVTSPGEGAAGNQVTINLSGVTDIQTLTVGLFDVDDGSNVSDVGVRVRMRIGDVTANDAVNSSDVSMVKMHLGEPVDGTNFRTDVNANGAVNASDVSLTKSKIP